MGKHRTRLQILKDILSVINDNRGAKKTQIMYRAYLSYKLLVRYLDEVIEAGLVSLDTNNSYKLTKKGSEYLERYRTYRNSRMILNNNKNHCKDQKLLLEKMCTRSKGSNSTTINQ